MSLTGFGEDASSRWWLTGVEWLWKSRSDEKGKGGKRFKGVERQEILDLVNREILPPENVGEEATSAEAEIEASKPKKVDAPLVRLVNCIRKASQTSGLTNANISEHLSLTYQLEVLFQQAMSLSREKWRNHLLVEIDRPKKKLVLKYWV